MDSFDPSIIGLPDDRVRKPTPSPTDGLSAEVQKKIVEAFETFDHEHNKTVDAREIGTIMRSLGFCPSEAELQEVMRDMEDPNLVGYVPLDRFMPAMAKIIKDQKFQAAGIDQIRRAFHVLDPEGKGDLTVEEVRKHFGKMGEPFAQDEIEEMLNAALDPNTKTVIYKNFAHFLTVDEDILSTT